MTVLGSLDKFARETGEPAQAMILPPAPIEIDTELVITVAEKYACAIPGPPVNYLN